MKRGQSLRYRPAVARTLPDGSVTASTSAWMRAASLASSRSMVRISSARLLAFDTASSD